MMLFCDIDAIGTAVVLAISAPRAQRGLHLFNRLLVNPFRRLPYKQQCQLTCEAMTAMTLCQDAPLAVFSQSVNSPQREITTKLSLATVFGCQEVPWQIKPNRWGQDLVILFLS